MDVPLRELKTALKDYAKSSGWKWGFRLSARHARGSEHTIRFDLTSRDALALATLITVGARVLGASGNQLPREWPVPILPGLNDSDEWLTTAGVAERLNVSKSTITSWCTRGCPKRCPFPQPGRVVHYRNYWKASVIDEWAIKWRVL